MKRKYAAIVAGVLLAMGMPLAARASSDTSSATLNSGGLSVTNQGTHGSFTAQTLGTSSTTGSLPEETYSDDTGTGAGWHGTVATTCFTFTGSGSSAQWAPGSSTALVSNGSGSYTNTSDRNGYYKMDITGNPGADGHALAYSFSEDAADGSGGTGTTDISSANQTVALDHGVTITFATANAATYSTSDTYLLKVGNLSSSALHWDGTGTISKTSGTNTTDPGFENAGTLSASGSDCSAGTSITFITTDGAVNQGMGTWNVTPDATLTLPSGSNHESTWTGTWTATEVFTIVTAVG
jgi:hypothetical protein